MRFPIRFTGANRAMVVLGILPSRSYVELDGGEVRVRMTWAFAVRFPRSSVRSVGRYEGRVFGWGAHGWRGEWLVNGSSKGIVELTIDPPTRAHVMGAPITLKTLWVSVTEPEALIEACTRKV